MKEKIIEIIFHITNNKIIYNNENINLFESGILDSMGLIELLTEIEEIFEVTFTSNDISKDNFETVDNIIKFINNKKQYD